jgi:hypothetical protein
MTTFTCGCTTSWDNIVQLRRYCDEHNKRGDGPLSHVALFDSWFTSLPQLIRDQVNWDGSRWAMELAWRASRGDYTLDASSQQWITPKNRAPMLAAFEQTDKLTLVDAESGAAVPTKEDTQ